MFKFISILGFIFISANVFAAVPDFSVLSQGGQPGIAFARAGNTCIQAAWTAANPTDDQNQQAQGFLTTAQTAVTNQQSAIKQDFQAISTAWAASPISRDDVITAETAFQNDSAPSHDAVRDAAISVLNLLSADQRTAFDASLKSCVPSGGGHHGGGQGPGPGGNPPPAPSLRQ